MQLFFLLFLVFCFNSHGFIEITNKLDDTVEVEVELSNGERIRDNIPPFALKRIYASVDGEKKDIFSVLSFHAITQGELYQIGAEFPWDDAPGAYGVPVYGKLTGNLYFNGNTETCAYFYADESPLTDYNGRIIRCQQTKIGYDTKRNPIYLTIDSMQKHRPNARFWEISGNGAKKQIWPTVSDTLAIFWQRQGNMPSRVKIHFKR